jgi:hypothetical protein
MTLSQYLGYHLLRLRPAEDSQPYQLLQIRWQPVTRSIYPRPVFHPVT